MSPYAYRRGSIFWALTLIAVGVLFLYNNFNPAVRPWHIIGKYWPVMIIFWGFSKLIDYFQVQAHPEKAAPPLFTASEVILLVLVLAFGTLLSRIVLRPWHHWVGEGDFADLFLSRYTYTQTFTQELKAPPRLLVVNRRGDVEIHGGDQSLLEGVVKKVIRAPNEAEARKLSDQVKIEVVEQAGRSLVQSNLDSLERGEGIELDLTLRVPRETAAEINSESGDIVAEGLRGEQALNARRGDVRVTNVEGLVRVKKQSGATEIRDVKGSVEVEGHGRDLDLSGVTGTVTINGDFSGDLQFRNLPQTLRFVSSRTTMTAQKLTGQLTMEVGSLDATGLEGPFELSTKQKDISLNEFRHSVKITNTNGDVRLRTTVAPNQPIQVDLEKGEIELVLPENSSFRIEARSRHGDVECDFPDLKVSKEGDTPAITGERGRGGPTIRLTTAYGAIRVLRQGSVVVPPSPAPPAHPAPPPPPKRSEGEKEISLYRPSARTANECSLSNLSVPFERFKVLIEELVS